MPTQLVYAHLFDLYDVYIKSCYPSTLNLLYFIYQSEAVHESFELIFWFFREKKNSQFFYVLD